MLCAAMGIDTTISRYSPPQNAAQIFPAALHTAARKGKISVEIRRYLAPLNFGKIDFTGVFLQLVVKIDIANFTDSRLE